MKRLSTFLLLISVFLPVSVFCFDLDEYKAKVKNENLKTFYDEEVKMNYSDKEIMYSGVDANLKKAEIKKFIQDVSQDRASKEAEIDAAKTKEEVDAILGVMTH